MVLKKCKGSLARTGNTVRRGGKQSMQQALKTSFITKRSNGISAIEQSPSDELFDGDKSWNDRVPFSLNKRNRWMIQEKLDEKCEQYNETQYGKVDISDEDKSKRKTGKKCSKKKKKAEEYTTEKKTKVIEKTLLSGPKTCKTVYDFSGNKSSVKRGKSWRCRRDDTDDSSYDTVYEITSGVPSESWPLNITSQWRHREKHYESIYMRVGSSKNRKKGNNTDDLLADVNNLEDDDTDCDEEPDTSDTQVLSHFDRTELCNTYTLSDFTFQPILQPKPSKSSKTKEKQHSSIMIMEGEDNKDREFIYIEVEDTHDEVISEENDSYTEDKTRENTDQSEVQRTIIETVPHYQSLGGYLEMENVAVEKSTILKCRLEHLYGKGFLEGRSRPRKFGIILNFADHETGEDNKCFVIAEETRTDSLTNQAILNVKLIGIESHVAELADHIKRSGPQAFENLTINIERSQLLNMIIRTRNESPDTPEHLKSLTKWSPKTLPAEKAFNLLVEELFLEIVEEEADKDDGQALDNVEIVSFQCGICFENLSTLSTDDSMMQLEKCLHSFCRNCWISYVNQKAEEQAPIITCPELGCKATVDIITILSMLEEKLVRLYLKNKFEQFLAKRNDWKWCPGCEQVANCPGYLPRDTKPKVCDTPVLKCTCSKTWCFECQDNQHWPMDCEGMKRYKAIFQKESAQLFDAFGKIYETSVLVKNCPRCRMPIDKNGGCNNMLCRCMYAFCWRCTKHNCDPSKCKEVELKSITFTSFDSLGEKGHARAVRKALKFSYIKKELKVRKTKLGIARQSTSVNKRHPNNSLMGLMCKLFADLMDTCTVVEHIAATACVSKSKHYNIRLYKFTGSMDFLLSSINDMLKKDHIIKVNMKEVNYIANQIKNGLAKFLNMELHKDQH